MPTTPQQVQQLIIRVPVDLHRRIRLQAADQGRSISKVVTDLLDKTVPKAPPRRAA